MHIFYPTQGFSTVYESGILGFIFATIVQWNLLLAIFNLIPIPPLDGSKVFSLILPPKQAVAFMSLGNIGMLVLIFLLFFPIGGFSLMNAVYSLILFSLKLLGL
jgi:Zn-dependent protease